MKVIFEVILLLFLFNVSHAQVNSVLEDHYEQLIVNQEHSSFEAVTTQLSMGDFGAGNGGDVVRCNFGEGYKLYTLDSAMLKENSLFQLTDYKNSQEALTSIKNKLKNSFPLLYESFEEFVISYNLKMSKKRDVLWIAGVPRDLGDENLYTELPVRCESKIIQAVIRVDDSSQLTKLYYAPEYFKELKENGYELSIMLVHEYLRSFLKDASLIRVLNNYLHSEVFLTEGKEIGDFLKTVGLSSLEVGHHYDTFHDVVSSLKSHYEIIKAKYDFMFPYRYANKDGYTRLFRRDCKKAIGIHSVYKAVDINMSGRVARKYADLIGKYCSNAFEIGFGREPKYSL